MLVMALGITTRDNEFELNALSPIDTNELGKVTFVNPQD
jgi:hypothetical protein